MSELPDGWEQSRLGELAEFEMGQAPPGSASNFEGRGTPFVKAGEFGPRRPTIREWTTQPLKFAKETDVLICVVGATAGKLNMGADCAIGRSVAAIRPYEGLLPSVLYYQLLPQVQSLRAASTGSAQGVISKAQLAALPFTLPPLPEQKRIADKLEAVLGRVDACRARLARVPDLLKRFRQSVLAAATSGRLTEDWREEHNGVKWRDTEFGALIAEGPKNGLYKSSSCYGQGTRILRIDNFYSGKINAWSDLKRLDVTEIELRDFGLQVGDIVINRVNSMSHLGKSALVRDLPEPCVFESNMMRLRLDLTSITTKFGILVLTSPGGIAELQRNAKQAVNQASINQGDVKGVRIALPSLPEQQEIVRRVANLFAFADRIESHLNETQTTVDRLTPSTLAKAFRGEHVPQDPNDEPATTLLARIREQRIAEAAKPKKKRKHTTPKMKKLTSESVKNLIQKLPRREFSFEDLRGSVAGDYDELSKIVIQLLGEPNPVVKQSFDTEAKQMNFQRISG